MTPQADTGARGKAGRRRSGNTREIILEAARLRLERLGADGLRLQDIARDSGISHPTILHHFGSRDGLMIALVQSIGEHFVAEVVRRAPWEDASAVMDVSKVALAFDLLADKGYGQLVGWAMRQRPADVKAKATDLFDFAIQAFVSAKSAKIGKAPDEHWLKEIRLVTRLVLLAAVGEGLVGKLLPIESDTIFREWLSDAMEARVAV